MQCITSILRSTLRLRFHGTLSWFKSASILALLCYLPCAQAAPVAGTDSIAPVSAELCKDMLQRHVLTKQAPVGCGRLSLVKFSYNDFDGQLRDDGEIVVLDALAKHVLEIFQNLRAKRFPIAKVRLMNEYGGDDDASIDQNNTSAFNFRKVTGGSSISPHGFGGAIDLNPIQNPYISKSAGKLHVSPKAGEEYVDRTKLRPGMAEEVVDVFFENGFTGWGGYWKNPTDYQHFQVSSKLMNRILKLPLAEAEAVFEQYVQKLRACMRSGRKTEFRRSCAEAE